MRDKNGCKIEYVVDYFSLNVKNYMSILIKDCSANFRKHKTIFIDLHS